jgi:NADH-quinone oxidoreductase subunit G
VSERGDRAYIGIDESQLLDHPWAGNVVDLCPVGSLISKDFLHKARAWDLDRTASVCTGCSQGCNVTIDTRDNTVVRIRPRANLDVNRHFICDTGRMHYRWLNRGDRIEAPLLKEAGKLSATDWDTALERLAGLVRGAHGPIVILASAGSSTESLGLIRRLVDGKTVTAAVRIPEGTEAPLAGVPNLALRKERAPNGDGARLLGYSADWKAALKAAGSAALVILLDIELTESEAVAVGHAGSVVVLGTLETQALTIAALVLPVTNVAEEQGTFVNRDLRVQRYQQARSAPGMARPAWWIAAEAIALAGSAFPVPGSAEEAFETLAETIPAFGGLSYDTIGLTGAMAEQGTGAGAAR